MSVNEQKREQLKELHEARKEKTNKKIYDAIESMIEKGKKVNFSSVAAESGISKRTLYNKPEIADYIEKLREEQSKKKPAVKSDSKDAIIESLKRKIARLEKENTELRAQNNKKFEDLYENM